MTTDSSFQGMSESVPPSPSPERPIAPYDPPEPAPQAAAWERALRVIVREGGHSSNNGFTKSRAWRTNKRGRAAIRARENN